MEFQNILVAGIPLIAVIWGLVAFAKKMGVKGKALTATSLVLGLSLGLAYQVSLKLPSDFSGWFAAAIFGLGLGLVASGLYDVVKTDFIGGGLAIRSTREIAEEKCNCGN